jgi:hypothetical protein
MMLKDVQEIEATNEIYKMQHKKINALEEAKRVKEEVGKF